MYRPLTAEGQAALDAGLEEESVARLDQGHAERLARYAIGQAAPAFAASHPDAARPEMLQAMGAVMDSEPSRYAALAISDPAACLEIAYSKAREAGPSAMQASPGQGQTPSEGRRLGASFNPGLDPLGRFTPQDEERVRAAIRRQSHPDLDRP
jgi:hypothetical protein